MIGAILSSTARTAARSTPEVASVGWAITRLIVAPLATAPDHSTSRSASVSALDTSPGSGPSMMTLGTIGGRPKRFRKSATSCRLMLLSPRIAMFWAGPVNSRRKLPTKAAGRYRSSQNHRDRGNNKVIPPQAFGTVYPGWTKLTRPVALDLENTPPRWYAGCFRKLCIELTPATTGASAWGICGSFALAQWSSPLIVYL